MGELISEERHMGRAGEGSTAHVPAFTAHEGSEGRPPKGYSRDRGYEEIQVRTKNGRIIPVVDQIRVL